MEKDNQLESYFSPLFQLTRPLAQTYYPNVKFNFQSNQFYKDIIDKYVPNKLKEKSFIAGGCFTTFDESSIINSCSPQTYSMLKEAKDVDIFITKDPPRVLKVINHIIYHHQIELLEINKTNFKFNDLSDNVLYNIIFVKTNVCDTLHQFLFSGCKIAYDFKSDSILTVASFFPNQTNSLKHMLTQICTKEDQCQLDLSKCFTYNTTTLNEAFTRMANVYFLVKYVAKGFPFDGDNEVEIILKSVGVTLIEIEKLDQTVNPPPSILKKMETLKTLIMELDNWVDNHNNNNEVKMPGKATVMYKPSSTGKSTTLACQQTANRSSFFGQL